MKQDYSAAVQFLGVELKLLERQVAEQYGVVLGGLELSRTLRTDITGVSSAGFGSLKLELHAADASSSGAFEVRL